MRTLDLMVKRLAYVVQQAGSLGQLDVQAQLAGHQSGQMGDLYGMFEHVLSVGGPVPEPA